MNDMPKKPSREEMDAMRKLLETAEPRLYAGTEAERRAASKPISPEDRQYIAELSSNIFIISELAHRQGKEIAELTEADLVGMSQNAIRTLRLLQQPDTGTAQNILSEIDPAWGAAMQTVADALLHKPFDTDDRTAVAGLRIRIPDAEPAGDGPPQAGQAVAPEVKGKGPEIPHQHEK